MHDGPWLEEPEGREEKEGPPQTAWPLAGETVSLGTGRESWTPLGWACSVFAHGSHHEIIHDFLHSLMKKTEAQRS